MTTKSFATIDDLYGVPGHGKAELVNGEVLQMSPTGGLPGRAALKISSSLARYEESHGGGFAVPDNVGFLVALPNRQSFSPNAAWWTGTTISMDFLQGAPAFAVEIRSKNDYGRAAEHDIAAKIADYFAAGTRIVWDVDLLGEDVIRKYVAGNPTQPVIFRKSDVADAEPVVPGWRFPVGSLIATA